MTFRPTNLQRLGDQIPIELPRDANGFLGRECPSQDCESYFKIKPGTGLKGENLPCHCPYCGHVGSHDTFFTKEQVEYAKSIALREVMNAIRKDLKALEFDHKPKGAFGIGISMKLQPGRPIPIRHYRERSLETTLACDSCTLEYSVFGLFAFCADCGAHNSLQILIQNLDLTRRQLDLAGTLSDPALAAHLVEDALENCVSAFDGFAREACRVRADLGTNSAQAQSISFQNLRRASQSVLQLFNFDFEASIPQEDFRAAYDAFMRRHLLAHRGGVIDQKYLDETGESPTLLGRRVKIRSDDVRVLTSIIGRLGAALVQGLPEIRRGNALR